MIPAGVDSRTLQVIADLMAIAMEGAEAFGLATARLAAHYGRLDTDAETIELLDPLPAAARDPILAGFRLLFEVDPDRNPYYEHNFNIADHRAVTIPPCAVRFLIGEAND